MSKLAFVVRSVGVNLTSPHDGAVGRHSLDSFPLPPRSYLLSFAPVSQRSAR